MTCKQGNMNFVLPINLERLQNERLWLEPIESCTDEQLQNYVTQSRVEYPEVWRHYAWGPFETLESYKTFYHERYGSDPGAQFFAIFLKAGTISKGTPGGLDHELIQVEHGTFAGTTGLMYTNAMHSRTEIGYVMVVPRFHRTLVNTHAQCLLLKHLLEPVEGGDLQLRRVEWQAHSENKASIKAAQRLGFVLEGVMRWVTVMWPHKNCVSDLPGSRKDGLPVRDLNGNTMGPGRHSALLSMCWDDWLDGKRAHVLQLLDRE